MDDLPNRLRGVILVVLSASLFAVVDLLSKLLAETQSVGQIVWARYTIAFLIVLATTRPAGWRAMFRTSRPGLQLGRAALPIGVSISMVLAVRYLPLAEATVLLFSAPFVVVALSAPFLGERVHPSSWIAVAVGFVAVILVARPGFSQLSHYAVFPLAAAVFYAILQLATRKLGALGERPQTTLAWTLGLGTLVAAPFAAITWEPADTRTWILMLSLGLVFGLAQGLLAHAYRYAPAGLLAPLSYVQVVAATILGGVVFGVMPDLLTILGVVLIIGAGIYVARAQTR